MAVMAVLSHASHCTRLSTDLTEWMLATRNVLKNLRRVSEMLNTSGKQT